MESPDKTKGKFVLPQTPEKGNGSMFMQTPEKGRGSMLTRTPEKGSRSMFTQTPEKGTMFKTPEKSGKFVSPNSNGGKFLLPESPAKVRRVEASPRKVMTELSPRRVPRSPLRPPQTPPNWKRPDEVMKSLRLKRSSLASRFNQCDTTVMNNSKTIQATNTTAKRKNPFRVGAGESEQSAKKSREENTEQSASSSLFRLLGLADPQYHHKDPLNFDTIIEKIKLQNEPQKRSSLGGSSVLPVDWSLRSKVRFMSAKPFPWTQTLKACEEASGVTGFVRRVDEDSIGLDMSVSSGFHQCCLYWQYPCFPWLTLYPRKQELHGAKKQQVDKTLPSFATHPLVKESLLSDFTESFRSVFQLVRARHCPYFYLISPTFSCLFRAAGINNSCEISAMVCPTTQGFRQLLRDNEIEFTLPLRQRDKKTRSSGGNTSDLSTGDSVTDQPTVTTVVNNSESEEEDEGETREWLTKLGLPTKHLDKLDNSNPDTSILAECELDGTDESLVYVEGADVSSLYNFLINFKSIVVSTGPSANIPPTILAPVAFARASLSTLQVRDSLVKVDVDSYHSLEICGPILPDILHQICDILDKYLDEFSVTFQTDLHTKSFSLAAISKGKDKESEGFAGSAFCIENLRDCGMKSNLLARFCSPQVQLIDSIKFSNSLYNIE